MELTDRTGERALQDRLLSNARTDSIVHALLFSGPKGSGRRTAAKQYIRAVLCEAEPAQRPCGVCSACKKVDEGLHPDVHTVRPDGNFIKIEQIRDLLDELALTAREGRRKIAVIEQADRMNENAQNALLKTLESPVGETLFILISAAPEGLLTTIRSRCLQVRFRNREIGDCASILVSKGIAEDKALLLSALAQGSIGRALEICEDKTYMELREEVVDTLEKLKRPQDILKSTEKLGKKEHREDILEVMELWGRDLMRVQNGMEPFQSADKARLTASRLLGTELLDWVKRLRAMSAVNVSWTNALEKMDFELLLRKR